MFTKQILVSKKRNSDYPRQMYITGFAILCDVHKGGKSITGETLYEIVTDFGNRVTLTEKEINDEYYLAGIDYKTLRERFQCQIDLIQHNILHFEDILDEKDSRHIS